MNPTMTDTIHHYSHSKRSRRLQSVRKTKEKFLLKKRMNRNTCSSVQRSQRSKSQQNQQRKEWSKYNKKSKPRQYKRCPSLIHVDDLLGYESPEIDGEPDGAMSRYSDYGDDFHSANNQTPIYYEQRRFECKIFTTNVVTLKRDYDVLTFTLKEDNQSRDTHSEAMLWTDLSCLMTHHFTSDDIDGLRRRFDLSTFKGQCAYWNHIGERTYIGERMFYRHYRKHCETGLSLEYETANPHHDFIRIPGTVHSLCMSDHVVLEAERQFKNDLAAAHLVVCLAFPSLFAAVRSRRRSASL